jgi:CRISPR-associated protein Csx10
MNLWVEVHLRSDTCFSSGVAGRAGDVDTDVHCDPRTGLPFLPGRTLKGLLAEECDLLLHSLEPSGEGPLHRARLLLGNPGDPQGAAVRVGDGHLHAETARRIQEDAAAGRARRFSMHAVRGALTRIRRQTRVDQETGGPALHSLRAVRTLRAGLRFYHPFEVPDRLSPAEQALLAGSLAMVRRVGLHRHRGLGLVHLRLLERPDEASQDLIPAWLRGLRNLGEEAPRVATMEAARAAPEPGPADQRIQISYQLVLDAPLLIATHPHGGDALRHVSGGAILGALAARYLQRYQPPDAARDPVFRRLFLSGETRFLNAYPEQAGRRLLPAPCSLSVHKDDEVQRSVLDLSAQPGLDEAELRAVDGWFLRIDRADPDRPILIHRTPTQSLRFHHQRNRRSGRPDKEGGGIFTYASLDARERLRGQVLCADPQSAACLRDLFEMGALRLGRSRSATYGGVASVQELATAPFAAETEGQGEGAPRDRLVVTLLSDYLGRDARGQASPGALLGELLSALDLSSDAPRRLFLRHREVSGYVARWAMPRPREIAVAAGSVIVLHGPRPAAQRIADLLWHGLGERRAEGFGRVAVDWHGGAGKYTAQREEVERPLIATPQGDPAGLRRGLLRDALRAHLIRRAAADAHGFRPPPSSPSLVARLRGRVRTATGTGDIAAFLKDMDGKKAGRALDRSWMRRKTLRGWLTELLEDRPDPWLDTLQGNEVAYRLDLPLDLLDRDDRFALLRTYLDALCEELRRRARAEGAR